MEASRKARSLLAMLSVELDCTRLALHNYHDTHNGLPAGEYNTGGGQGARRHSGFVGLLPFIEQQPLYSQISGDGFMNVPWDGNYQPFRTNIPGFNCPSDSTPEIVGGSIGKTNYMFSRGDSTWDHNQWAGNGGRGLRGMFTGQGGAYQGTRSFADVTDGLSNSIMMSERTKAVPGVEILDGGTVRNLGSTFRNNNPAECLAQTAGNKYVNTDLGRWAGHRWPDGAPAFTGCTTVLGPNTASCTQGGWDGEDGIYEPMSRHTGGVHCAFGDGAVRFISDSIDTGNRSAPPPDAPGGTFGPSPYGVWGSLGSINGGDVVGEY
jgi:hypothetical protein